MFCVYCGKQHNRKGYYCSLTCAKKHYYGDIKEIKLVEKKCPNKKFNKKPISICKECGNKIYNEHRKFCSRDCYYTYIRKKEELLTKRTKYRGSKLIRWSKEVRKRANYICEICGEPAIDSHHIVPVCVDDSLKYDLDNGIAVCLKCHRKKHPDLPDSFFKNRF